MNQHVVFVVDQLDPPRKLHPRNRCVVVDNKVVGRVAVDVMPLVCSADVREVGVGLEQYRNAQICVR